MSETWRGQWWVPEDPETTVGGVLVVHDDGDTTLQLVGGFDLEIRTPLANGNGYSSNGTFRDLPIVHGLCGNKKVTLIDCDVRNQTGGLGFAPLQTQDLRPTVALAGVHLPSVDERMFRQTELRLENLAAWARLGGIEREFAVDGSTASARVTQPDVVEVETSEGKFLLSTRTDAFRSEEKRDSLSVIGTVTTVLTIELADGSTYGGSDRLVKAFMDLLTLASGEACGIISEKLHYTEEIAYVEIGGIEKTAKMPRTVDVLREHLYHGDAESPPQRRDRFLFTCDDKSFPDIVSIWLPLRQKALNACNILFGLKYARPTLAEFRLLIVAVAAEALHRALYPGSIPMLPTDFERIQDAALRSQASEADRTWVKSRLRNEPSYRDRMLDLANKPARKAVEYIIPDRDSWAKNLGDARNGLAHKAEGGEPLDMFQLESVTEQLLHLVLLNELGISPEIQVRAMNSNRWMATFAQERRQEVNVEES